MRRNRVVLLVATGLVVVLAGAVHGNSWHEGRRAVKPGTPDFAWQIPDDPDIQCGHVALANALWYCDKTTRPP